jgi:Sigma-70 factor, region 1.1
VTFDELNDLWLATMTEPEDVEAVMAALSDDGIYVIDDN